MIEEFNWIIRKTRRFALNQYSRTERGHQRHYKTKFGTGTGRRRSSSSSTDIDISRSTNFSEIMFTGRMGSRRPKIYPYRIKLSIQLTILFLTNPIKFAGTFKRLKAGYKFLLIFLKFLKR